MYFQSLTLVHGEPFPDPLPLSRCFLQIKSYRHPKQKTIKFVLWNFCTSFVFLWGSLPSWTRCCWTDENTLCFKDSLKRMGNKNQNERKLERNISNIDVWMTWWALFRSDHLIRLQSWNTSSLVRRSLKIMRTNVTTVVTTAVTA